MNKQRFKDVSNVTILIDFNNQVMRSLFGTDELTNSDGINTACVIGFMKVLRNAITQAQKIYSFPKLVVCYDRSPTRKRNLYKKYINALSEHKNDKDWDGKNKNERIRYKGNRTPLDLNYDPLKICKDYLSCIPHTDIWCEEEEADDVMSSYIHKNKCKKIFLYSTDKDMWQLEDHYPNLSIRTDSNTGVTSERMIKSFQTEDKNKIALYKMIRGDSGDNVKGIMRWQFKRTIKAYNLCDGTIENYLYYIAKIFGKDHDYTKKIFKNINLLRLNYQLVKLHTDLNYESNIVKNPDENKWRKLCHMYETPSLLNLSLLKIF